MSVRKIKRLKEENEILKAQIKIKDNEIQILRAQLIEEIHKWIKTQQRPGDFGFRSGINRWANCKTFGVPIDYRNTPWL